MPVASQSILFFRAYQAVALPLYGALIEDLCASPELPLEFAGTLEDIGHAFLKLSEDINGEVARRGLLPYETDADRTVEAHIDGVLAALAPQAERDGPSLAAADVMGDPTVQSAIRLGLLMTHDLPVMRPLRRLPTA